MTTMPQLAKWKPRPELLLCPNIPKPLHCVNPRTILGQAWWNQRRQEAYRVTDFHCAACGVWKFHAKGHQWLEGHEIYRIDYVRGRMYLEEVVALCSYCHEFIHSGRLQALMEQGKITQGHFAAVIQHGNKVLRDAGLTKPEPYAGKTAPWGKWRLILNRRYYKPKYGTPEEWAAHFSGVSGEVEYKEEP